MPWSRLRMPCGVRGRSSWRGPPARAVRRDGRWRSREVQPCLLYGGGGLRFRAWDSVEGPEPAACFTEQLVDLVKLGFGCVRDAVLASDAIEAGAGVIRYISE